MSDGHITSGSNLYSLLKSKLYPQYTGSRACKIMPTHTFIGFGSQHDSKLLKELSNIPKGDYFFIDSLENAGMVYGEVLYNSLYEYINNLTIRINNGEIYNHEKNIWGPTLYVPNIASGQTRTWHIRQRCTLNSNNKETCEETETNTESHEIINMPTTVQVSFDIVSKTTRVFLPEVTMCYPEQNSSDEITIDLEVEKYLWRQKTQEIMAKVKNYINDTNTNIPCSTSLYPNATHNTFAGSLGAYGTPWGCVNTITHTSHGDDGIRRPVLHHNKKTCYDPAFREEIPTPPPSPANKKDFTLEQQHQILDMAKQGAWTMVWSMIDAMPSLVDSMPFPRRYNLIHHAIDQENSTALRKLLEQGAKVTTTTLDGLSVDDLIKKANTASSNIMKNIVEKHLHNQQINKAHLSNTFIQEEYITELDNFMSQLKQYMTENNLEDDDFMKNLCDDIYVCTKSITSKGNIGNMYLNTRSASQGKERAYNIQDFGDLEHDSQPLRPTFRNLSNHQTSSATRTAYTNPRLSNVMRTVSEGGM